MARAARAAAAVAGPPAEVPPLAAPAPVLGGARAQGTGVPTLASPRPSSAASAHGTAPAGDASHALAAAAQSATAAAAGGGPSVESSAGHGAQGGGAAASAVAVGGDLPPVAPIQSGVFPLGAVPLEYGWPPATLPPDAGGPGYTWAEYQTAWAAHWGWQGHTGAPPGWVPLPSTMAASQGPLADGAGPSGAAAWAAAAQDCISQGTPVPGAGYPVSDADAESAAAEWLTPQLPPGATPAFQQVMAQGQAALSAAAMQSAAAAAVHEVGVDGTSSAEPLPKPKRHRSAHHGGLPPLYPRLGFPPGAHFGFLPPPCRCRPCRSREARRRLKRPRPGGRLRSRHRARS